MDAKELVEKFQAKSAAGIAAAAVPLIGNTVGKYVMEAVELGQPISRSGLQTWLALEAATAGLKRPLYEAALKWLAAAPPEPSSSR